MRIISLLTIEIPISWYMECHRVGIVGMQKTPYLCTQIKLIIKNKSYEDNESDANARVLLLLQHNDGNDNEEGGYIYNRYKQN